MSVLDESRARTPLPSEDPFYGPVASLRSPGTLVRSRRVPVVHDSVGAAWQLVHASTGARGQRIAVSGTLLLPVARYRGRGRAPVLTYGVGVHGLGRDAAPSHLLVRGKEPELAAVAEALARGWAVTVTDGDGLGMPGPHTYGASAPGGHAMLDVVRAAAAVVPQLAGAPVLAWGYSEGGRCAAAAAELHPAHAPALDLVAVAAGGVPSDLRAMALALDGGPFSGLNLAVLVGLAHAHRDPALAAILSEEGRAAAERAAGADAVRLVLEHPEPLHAHTVRTEPWDDPTWSALLTRERLGQRCPRVPVLVYHVRDDELVPPELGTRLVRDYRARGARVEHRLLDGDGHLAGVVEGAGQAVAWLAARLDERAAAAGG